MSYQNRKAVITGGSKGIGKAIAERFAQEGIEIYLLASNEKKFIKTADELGFRNVLCPSSYQVGSRNTK